MISLIKNLNSLDENEKYEIKIDDVFFKVNEIEINNRIKLLKLPFKIEFIQVKKELEFNTYEIDQKILEKLIPNLEKILKKIPLKKSLKNHIEEKLRKNN